MSVWDEGSRLRSHAYRLRPPPPVCVRAAPTAPRATAALPAAFDATTLPSAEPAAAISSARTAAATRAGWRVCAATATAAGANRRLLAAGAPVA